MGQIPPCDPATCDGLGIGAACAFVEGQSVCSFPCTPGGSECELLMLECTGTDDAGNLICQSPPCLGAGEGEPCEISGFGSIGTCTSGECTCTSDAECTADGLTCNA